MRPRVAPRRDVEAREDLSHPRLEVGQRVGVPARRAEPAVAPYGSLFGLGRTPTRRTRARTRPAPLVVGVDIGGTKVAAGVVTAAGEVVDSARAETPHRSQRPDVVEATICRVVRELTERHDVAAVGIGAAGFIDATGSTVLFSPHLSWREEPLRDRVAARLGLPVVVENDANAAAWAEHRFGAGRGEEHLVCVTLGTGIGGAVVLSGTLLRGRYGLAGEFGHMQVVPDGHPCECGGRGCWEQYVSGHALLRAARALIVSGSPLAGPLLASAGGDPDALTGPLVTELARGGDPGAVRLLAEMGAWFGTGLANLAAAFDPGTFVIGGGVSDAGELLLGPARESFSRALTGRGYRPEARVVRAQLGPDAGLVGAADLARSRVSGLRRPRLGTQQGWLYGRGAWAVAPGRD